jgi:hypothetical protein
MTLEMLEGMAWGFMLASALGILLFAFYIRDRAIATRERDAIRRSLEQRTD